ncbi:MAG: PHP domain-containing protein [Planctomycetota bacterium]|nr:PHP domain-containing protein [Planctomycetota bacterium]
MKIELHLHTNRYSGCAAHSPADMMRRLIETGYDVVFITEHDAVWSELELAELQRDFSEIKILPGMEISLRPGFKQHLLVLGTNDKAYLRIPVVADILQRARAEDCLTVLAHPFRWEGGADMLKANLRPDAMEARTCNQALEQAETARREAARLGLPVVNAGDVHAVGFINRFWIETDRPVRQAADLRRILISGAYENRVGG